MLGPVRFFAIGYIALLLAVLVEAGSGFFPKGDRNPTEKDIDEIRNGYGADKPDPAQVRKDIENVQKHKGTPPGYGIRSTLFPDSILLLSMTWMLLSTILPQRVQGRVQGIITLVIGIIVGILAAVAIYTTLLLVMLMLGLLLATPFGTIVYFAVWGFFDVSGAKAILAFCLLLKLVFIILTILSDRRFLKVKSMLFMMMGSLILTFLVTLLITIVPRPLASITDALGGVIDAVAGLILCVIAIVMSLTSVLRAIRVDRSSATAEG